MKILIIQSKGSSENFNEGLCLQSGFHRLGENAILWGDGFDIFKTPFDEISKDCELIVVTENDSLSFIPELKSHPAKKVFWSRNGHIETEFVRQKEFCDKNGISIVLNSSHVSIDRFKSDSVKSTWFPLCVEPQNYPARTAAKAVSLTFCGDARPHSELLTFLDIHFTIVPQTAENKVDFINKISQAYINFIVCPPEMIVSEIFETVASGTIVCTNKVQGLESLFNEQEIITYDTIADLRYKLYYHLHNQQPTNDMIVASRARLLNSHTYTHRANQILHITGKE
jgi:hypothetical protein